MSSVARSETFGGKHFLTRCHVTLKKPIGECAFLFITLRVLFHHKTTGKKYPFFGTQWHPEKSQFEWEPKEAIDHSPDAIRIGQYMANFFVNQGINSDTPSTFF